jgi:zinc transport system ATP-binding protein
VSTSAAVRGGSDYRCDAVRVPEREARSGIAAVIPERSLATVIAAEDRSSTDIVRLDGVSVRFGGLAVLRDVSLSVHEGECVCVRGANGSGKTTLLRLLAGVVRPSGGSCRGPRACSYVPPALAPPPMSVAGWLRGVRRDRLEDPVPVLAGLGFDGDMNASCRELSFGNLRKVLLADAFTATAMLLAVDEVHVGLDHRGRSGLQDLVVKARDRGAGVVVAAQDDDDIDGVDRTLVVRDGAVSVDGRTAALVQRTLLGPRAAEAAMLEAAERFGFRPIHGVDQ